MTTTRKAILAVSALTLLGLGAAMASTGEKACSGACPKEKPCTVCDCPCC